MDWIRKKDATKEERARWRVLYALAATTFFLPLNIFLMEACFVLTLLLSAWYVWHYERRSAPVTKLSLPVIGFAVAALLSLAGSPHFIMGLGFYVFTVLQYVLLYHLVRTFIQGREERRFIFSCLLASTLIVALYGLYQYAHMLTLHEADWVDNSAFPLLKRRMYSTLYNPNLLSAFLLMLISAAASLFVCSREMKPRLGCLAFLGLLMLCLVLTYSRGAWLSVCALIFFFGLVWDKRVWLLFLGLPLILFCYHGGVADRLMSIFSHSEADTSVSMRMDMWAAAWQMAKDHPLLGIGWGAFKYVYPVYNELIQEAGIVIFHAHNMYLNILAETGLAGFFFAMWFFFGNLWYAVKYIKRKSVRDFDYALALTMAASVLALTISCISDYDLFSTQISLTFWLLSGLFASLYEEDEKFRAK